MDISTQLKGIRKEMGKTQKELASELGLPQQTWANYETGHANPPLKVLIKLAEMGYTIKGLSTGVVEDMKEQGLISDNDIAARSAEWRKKEIPYLSKDDIKDGFVIPILEQSLSAGKGQPLPDSDVYRGYIEVPGELKRYGKNLAALQVNGDSMEPTLKRGDLVICDSCGWDGEGVYVIHMDGCGYVKRLSHKPGKIIVISDNPKYEAWEEPDESQSIEIIGRVHYTLKHVD